MAVRQNTQYLHERYNSDGPKGGLRITSDEDRDFYRLAKPKLVEWQTFCLSCCCQACSAAGRICLCNQGSLDRKSLLTVCFSAILEDVQLRISEAIHPLFFEWTADSSKQVLDDERAPWHTVALEGSCLAQMGPCKAGYQVFLMSIIAHFLFQAFLVLISVACFTKYRFE